MFRTPVDIGNRACQHCGVPRINETLGFAEDSQRADEISFCYGKLKQAELRRNVWRFATRRACLRPIGCNTMLVAPALWESATTYFQGSLVTDETGFIWQSRIANNLGNQPENSSTWEPYFGPLTVSLYDSTANYLAGELAYTAPGDGSYNVYLSLVSGNAIDPSLPNQWDGTAVYSQNQVVQQFPAWDSATDYAAGSTVVDPENGGIYSAVIDGTYSIPPSLSPNWSPMPTLQLTPQQSAPQTSPIVEWAAGTVYSLGSFALFDGSVWVSIANSNSGNPPNAAGSAYWAMVTGGTLYMSAINLNTGNNPADAPAAWSATTTYSAGEQVAASDGLNYTATSAGGNLDQNPAGGVAPAYWTQGGLTAWITAFTQGGGNSQWLQVGGADFPAGVALTTLDIVYPLGSGPLEMASTKNVFRLPAGYLRNAPQDPKAGSVSFLGFPGNLTEDDWTYEANYLVTWEVRPIVLRFVADVADVTAFDPMFCEAFAAKIAAEVCEPLTQSTEKMTAIAAAYKTAITEAITVDGIEEGRVEPRLDDLIACRL